jgi:hypothetical protein
MSTLPAYLAREFPTATAAEIALALDMAAGDVRRMLKRSATWDTAEYGRRRHGGIDMDFVRIMKKRVGRSTA